MSKKGACPITSHRFRRMTGELRSLSMSDVEKPEEVAAPVVGSLPIPREAEVLPSYEVEGVDVDYERMLAVAEKRAKFISGVRKLAVSQTRTQDWLARRQKNGAANYDLMGPGAERIRSFCNVGFVNKTRRVEEWTKESGRGYTIIFEAECFIGTPRTGCLPVLGACSSSDEFFSTEHSEIPLVPENPEQQALIASGEGRPSNDGKTLYIRRRIPASEVDKTLIEKSALCNLVVNGVTRVLGLRKMSAEDLKGYGIDVDKIAGFEYGSGKAASGRLSPAEEQKRDEIKKMLVEMAGGDEKKALEHLKSRTAFNDYKGCESWDRLTPKQLVFQYERVKGDYTAWREGSPQEPPKRGPQKQPGQKELL